jgi:hypothetical protein
VSDDIVVGQGLCYCDQQHAPGEHPICASDLSPEARALLEAAVAYANIYEGGGAAWEDARITQAARAFAESVKRGG